MLSSTKNKFAFPPFLLYFAFPPSIKNPRVVGLWLPSKNINHLLGALTHFTALAFQTAHTFLPPLCPHVGFSLNKKK
eukprot:m.134096 g.134096  ORF g.134096 m.134096 type:complete len:77 (+) comp9499_c0_seq1:273-503(+)